MLLGIDKNEKKRKHFTLCHENNEFRYDTEIEGRIYWACKVPNCPGMVEEENYKMRMIKDHVHISGMNDRQTTKWQDNPWYRKPSTDNYKHDATEAYNINNGLKMSRDHVQPDDKKVPRASSREAKDRKRISRHFYFNIPSQIESQPVPSSVTLRQSPDQLKRDSFGSGLDISEISDSLGPVMNCTGYRQQRFWILVGIFGLLFLTIVAMALSLYFIDKSILDSPLPKQNNEDVQQRTVPASSPTSATERTERASHTPTQDNTPTVTTTSPGEGTAESTSTTSQVTYSTTTQTTLQTTVQAIPLSTGAFAPIVFSGSLMLNKTWTAKLDDKRTSRYQLYSKAIVYELDTAFLTSPLRDLFNSSKVMGFSSGSVKVFFKITFHAIVKDDGQIDSSLVNAKNVQQTIERETARQQTTRTNGYLSTVMGGSITVKLSNAPVVFIGDLSLNESWNDSLNDPTSSTFQNLTAQLKAELLSTLIKLAGNEFLDIQILEFRKGSVMVVFKIIMMVNTTGDPMQINVSSVIEAIQNEANRQLQEEISGLLQKLIHLSVDDQTIANITTETVKTKLPATSTTSVITADTTAVTMTNETTTVTNQPEYTTAETQISMSYQTPSTTEIKPPTTLLAPTTSEEDTFTSQRSTTTTTMEPTPIFGAINTTMASSDAYTLTIPRSTTTTKQTSTLEASATSEENVVDTQSAAITDIPRSTFLATTENEGNKSIQPSTSTFEATGEENAMAITTSISKYLPRSTSQTISTTDVDTITIQSSITKTKATSTLETTTNGEENTTATRQTTSANIPRSTSQAAISTKVDTMNIQLSNMLTKSTSTDAVAINSKANTTTTQSVIPTDKLRSTFHATSITEADSTTIQLPTTVEVTTTNEENTISTQPTASTNLPRSPIQATTTTQAIATSSMSTTIDTATSKHPAKSINEITITTIIPKETADQESLSSMKGTLAFQTGIVSTETKPTTQLLATTSILHNIVIETKATSKTITTTKHSYLRNLTETAAEIVPSARTTYAAGKTTTEPANVTMETTVMDSQPTTKVTTSGTEETMFITQHTNQTTTSTSSEAKIQQLTSFIRPSRVAKETRMASYQPPTPTLPSIQLSTTAKSTTTNESTIIVKAEISPTITTETPSITKTEMDVMEAKTKTTFLPLATAFNNTTTSLANITSKAILTEPLTTFRQPRTANTNTIQPTPTVQPKLTTTKLMATTTESANITIQSVTTTRETPIFTMDKPSTTIQTPPITETTTSVYQYVCQDKNSIVGKGWICVLPFYSNITTETDSIKFCRIIWEIFICTLDCIEKDFNVTCPFGSIQMVVNIYSPILRGSLPMSYNPLNCDFKDDAMTTSLPTFSDFPIDLSTSTLHSSTIYNSFATLVPTSFEQKDLLISAYSGIQPTTSMSTSQTEMSSTVHPVAPVACMTRLPMKSICQDSNIVITNGWICVIPQVLNFTKNVDFSDFCRLVDVTFICVMDRIGRDYNQTCRSSDKILAVDVFSPMFKTAFSLKYDPIECYANYSTTSTSALSPTQTLTSYTTTAQSTTLTPSPLLVKCNDTDEILSKSLQCVLPHFANITTEKDKAKFCRVVDVVFVCIMTEIGSEFGVRCRESDQELAISYYGPILQSRLNLSFDPIGCFANDNTDSVPTLSSKPAMESPTMTTNNNTTTSSPFLVKCINSDEVMFKSLQCVLPYFGNITTLNDKEIFCRVVDEVFTCIMAEIGSEYGVKCRESDKELAISYYGPILQSRLDLSFNPIDCHLKNALGTSTKPITTRSTTLSIPYTTQTLNSTTTMGQTSHSTIPTSASTQIIQTNTLSTFIPECYDTTEVLLREWQCALPLYTNLTTAGSLQLFCSAIDSVFICIMDGIGAKYGVNCSEIDRNNAVKTYAPRLQSALALIFDPTNCYSEPQTPFAHSRARSTKQEAIFLSTVPTITDSPLLVKCGDDETIQSIGWMCALPLYINISTANDMTEFCREVDLVFVCIMGRISSDYGVVCQNTHKGSAVTVYSSTLQSISRQLFDPTLCYVQSTSERFTTTESPLLTKCRESVAITSAAYLCVLPLYTDMTSSDLSAFCRVVEMAFSCITNKIEVQYNISCRLEDKERMILNYGPEMEKSLNLRFSPTTCYNVTLESSGRIRRSPILPCQDSVTLLAKGIVCIRPFYYDIINESSSFQRFCSLLEKFNLCVMHEMGKEHNVTCGQTEYNTFVKTHSLILQATLDLAFKPEDCLMTSFTPITENPTHTTYTSPTESCSPCRDENNVKKVQSYCISSSSTDIKMAQTFAETCSLMANVFKCIITVIEAETNSKCSPSDEEFLARKYGTQLDAVVQVSIDPVWCYEVLPTPTVNPDSSSIVRTTATPVDPCLDPQQFYIELLPCVGPTFVYLRSETNISSYCGLIASSFGCVINRTEISLNTSCSTTDAASIAQAYGTEIRSKLSLTYDPAQCYDLSSIALTTTVVSDTSSMMRTMTTSVDPCLHSQQIYVELLPCVGPVYMHLRSEINITSFCRLIADSFGCVIKGTETALNSSCSFSDAANIARAYGSEIQNSLSLRYNPIQCYDFTSTFPTKNLEADTSPIVRTTTTSADSCINPQQISIELISCVQPVFFPLLSESNFTLFCGLIVNITGCIIDKIQNSLNITCPKTDAAAQAYASMIRGKLSGLIYDPVQCYPLKENETLVSSAPKTTSPSTEFNITSSNSAFTSTILSTSETSLCQDLAKITPYILPCVGPMLLSISSAKSITMFCGLIIKIFSCILHQTEAAANRKCSSGDMENLVKTIGPQMNRTLLLLYDPVRCFEFNSLVINETRSMPSSTTSTISTTPEFTYCRDQTTINTEILPCLGPSFLSITSAYNLHGFCRLMINVFNCIMNNIASATNSSCTADDRSYVVETIGPQINRTIAGPHDVMECSELLGGDLTTTIPTTTTRSQVVTVTTPLFSPTVSTARPFKVLHCGNLSDIFAHGINCIGPLYQKFSTETYFPKFCRLLHSVFECISDNIQVQYNTTCSSSDREAAKSLYGADIYRSIPTKFDPKQCPEDVSCVDVIKYPRYTQCFRTFFVFEKSDASSYNLRLSPYETCSLYRGSLQCLANHSECSLTDAHTGIVHHFMYTNSTINPSTCLINTSHAGSVCEDDTFSLLAIHAECGFYPILIPFDCHRHALDFITCAANAISSLDCSTDSFTRALSILANTNSSFYDRVNSGQGSVVVSCIKLFETFNTTEKVFQQVTNVPTMSKVQTSTLSSPASAFMKTTRPSTVASTKSPTTIHQVDGEWGPWGSYDVCSVTCGSGIKSRSRSCNNPAPTGGGKRCVGSSTSSDTCILSNCPIDGHWGPWGSYGVCSVRCGGGTQTRNRSCANPAPKHGGKTCSGSSSSSQSCNTQHCRIRRMSATMKLSTYRWSNDLLYNTSAYYQELHNTVMENFGEQFRKMPSTLGVEVRSFRYGGIFVDLVLSYNSDYTNPASLLNTLFLLLNHGYIHHLGVQNYLRYDHVIRSGNCPLVTQVSFCTEYCTGDSRCPGAQKCCSTGCGQTCTDVGSPLSVTTQLTTSTTSEKTTVKTRRTSTTTQLPRNVGTLSITMELQEYTWDKSLLNPQSTYYVALENIVHTNVSHFFRQTEGIIEIQIISFRAKHNSVDLMLQYNTNISPLDDISTKLISARNKGTINNLKITHFMTFDTQIKPGTCPSASVDGDCFEDCMGDGTCPGYEKCCSTGCGRHCTTAL